MCFPTTQGSLTPPNQVYWCWDLWSHSLNVFFQRSLKHVYVAKTSTLFPINFDLPSLYVLSTTTYERSFVSNRTQYYNKSTWERDCVYVNYSFLLSGSSMFRIFMPDCIPHDVGVWRYIWLQQRGRWARLSVKKFYLSCHWEITLVSLTIGERGIYFQV